MANVTPMTVVDHITGLLDQFDRVNCKKDDPVLGGYFDMASKARVRTKLLEISIVFRYNPKSEIVSIYKKGNEDSENTYNGDGVEVTFSESSGCDRTKHRFVVPFFHKDVVSMLTDVNPHNLWFVGPTGCGKTDYVEHLGKLLSRKVFQVNCHEAMKLEAFIGDETIKVDKESMQNFIDFVRGPALQAAEEGLDENGVEVGEPGILFVDEAAACPAHIAIALNRVLETRNARREISLESQGGKVVRSHSGFRIILAANTIGRGLTGLNDAGYTAQADALDLSTLKRITAIFRFGYNIDAECSILNEMIGDDEKINHVMKFRDAIRNAVKQNRATTPLSTRDIVHICDSYRVLQDLPKAIFYTLFNGIMPEEVAVYNEALRLITGVDALAACMDNTKMAY